jgi:hypothetical protein
MKRNPTFTSAAPALLFCLTLAGCEATKSSNPLSPSVAGPIAGVEITAPKMLEPAQGFKFKESQQPIKLTIENSTSNGVRPVSYMFEVAGDPAFTAKVYAKSGVAQGDGGRTSVTVERLDLGRGYYWRVRAEDGANTSTFAQASFEVLPKASLGAPAQLSPANGGTTSTRRPELLVGRADRNAAVGAVRYEFQVSTSAGMSPLTAALILDEGAGNTGYTPGADLAGSTTYFWRVRSTDGETTSAWSSILSFKTPAAAGSPSPSPSPSPAPGNGSGCALGNGPAIVSCIAAKYPEKRAPVGSIGERQENMKFLRDRVIEAGICSGMPMGWNLKRGGPELSIDVIAWIRPDGNMGVDIGFAYDDNTTTLQLVWSEIDLFAKVQPYPAFSCK